MINSKRRAGGREAKRQGQIFENRFYSLARNAGWTVIQIPSGCKWIGKNRIVPVDTPFDFCLFKDGLSLFCDVKSVQGKTFPYSSIETHQRQALCAIGKMGMFAGYIVFFREVDTYVFYSHKWLASLEPRQSFNPLQGIRLGSDNDLNLELIYGRPNEEKTDLGRST